MTNFIGVAFGAKDGKVIALATSEGLAVTDSAGLSAQAVLSFLYAIRLENENVTPKPTLVSFDMSVDFEILFGRMGKHDKNSLFGIRRELEESVNDIPLYDPSIENDMIEYKGFKVYYLSGKLLRISRPAKGLISLYDIASYFEYDNISDAADAFNLEKPASVIDSRFALLLDNDIGGLVKRCITEAETAKGLAQKIEAVLLPVDLKTRQWYGPSSIAAKALGKWGARFEGRKLTTKNAPYELVEAIDCAYFGGRVEAIKLGTIPDVRVFDLNSAYAFATTYLSQFHKPLRYSRKYDPNEPFSIWYIDYKLPKETTIGVVPTRAQGGALSYKLSGRGYYWQPEVEYLRQRYPGCLEIRQGYVGEYEQVSFAYDIHQLYDYRMSLKAKNDPGESIIKLALSNLYGKFAQNQGMAFYQCRAWAGWITSFVRRLLLEAVTGIEDKVICFAQDAVHLSGADAFGVQQSAALGGWKQSNYAEGLYLSPGIYKYSDKVTGAEKIASRGSNTGIDYERIASELSARQVSELNRAFFVGWRLAYQSPVRYESDYLSEVEEMLKLIPSRLKSRNYLAEFDWLSEFRDSKINSNDSGKRSARYFPTQPTMQQKLRLKARGWV